LGQADSGVLGKIAAFNKLALQLTPFAPVANMLGLGGQTIQQMEDAEKRLNAIALLSSRDGTNNATEEQIAAEMAAIVEREKQASRAVTTTNEAIDQGKAKTEQNAQIKQRLLEISLQLKEAEAANNSELVDHLKHSEDLYKGILKYKDAEDGYGMAVREANAELAKRNELLNKKTGTDGGLADIVKIREDYIASMGRSRSGMSPQELKEAQEISKRYHDLTRQNPELLRFDVQGKLSDLAKTAAVGDPIKAAVQSLIGGNAGQYFQGASLTEAERQRAATSGSRGGAASTAEADKIATETTLQKAVEFLKELTAKLPQPVLV
jgi:myosin heavy subunit